MCVVIVTEKLSLNDSILFSFRRSGLHPWPEGVLVQADRAVPPPSSWPGEEVPRPHERAGGGGQQQEAEVGGSRRRWSG